MSPVPLKSPPLTEGRSPLLSLGELKPGVSCAHMCTCEPQSTANTEKGLWRVWGGGQWEEGVFICAAQD